MALLMKNVDLVYAGMTGHSKKLAAAAAEALGIPPRRISKEPAAGQDAELLFIVGGIYGGESLPEMLEYVRSLDSEKTGKAALITSCASGRKGQESVRRILEEKGIPVVDEMICPGGFLFMKMGRPNRGDLRQAAEFALKCAAL